MRSWLSALLFAALALPLLGAAAPPPSALAAPGRAAPPAAESAPELICVPPDPRRFAYDTGGNITNGPSIVNEWVVGQRDAAGNVHVEPGAPSCRPPRGAPSR